MERFLPKRNAVNLYEMRSNLAEATAKQQDFDKARELAEKAYKLPGLAGTVITNLKRFCKSKNLHM